MQTQNRPITGHLPTWGLWERMVPEQVADDPASQAMLNIHLRRYETASRYVQNRRVLDIACGTGYGSKMLKMAGAAQVVGVDIAADTVQYAKQHYEAAGVEFVCADAEQFESPEQFDVIISFETIEHVPHPEVPVSAAQHTQARWLFSAVSALGRNAPHGPLSPAYLQPAGYFRAVPAGRFYDLFLPL